MIGKHVSISQKPCSVNGVGDSNPMKTFRSLTIFTLYIVILAGPATAQETRETFTREYLNAEEYRTAGVLLGEWPELARLVRWSERIENAISAEDETISDSLVSAFRVRVDTLAAAPLPARLGEATADSARGAIERLVVALNEAEEALIEGPTAPTRTGGDVANVEDEERALVTGGTVVRVPAGVRVGAPADSLPAADVEPRALNYVERLVLALETLDEIVHIVRTSQVTEEPDVTPARNGGEASSSTRREPPLRER